MAVPAAFLRKPKRSERGFTLVELLVSVVIVAIVISIAILSLSVAGDDRDLQTEARRFMSLVNVAQDDAMMQGRELGIELMTGSYRFVEYDALANQWTELVGDDVLRLRQLPEDLEFALVLEEQEVALNEDPELLTEEEDRADEQYAPHLLIYSSGDMTPFELALTRDELRVAMQGDLLGNLEIVKDED